MQKLFKTSKENLIRMQVVHLGKILFNLQFLAVAVMVASVLSFLIPALYYLGMICIVFLTLFTILANETFMSFWSGGEMLTKITAALLKSWEYTVPIAAVLAVGSIICLCLGKNKNNVPRIVVSSIILVLALIVLILKLINKGA